VDTTLQALHVYLALMNSAMYVMIQEFVQTVKIMQEMLLLVHA
jgi:hypothetical protein